MKWMDVQEKLMQTPEVKAHRKEHGDHLYPTVCKTCAQPILNDDGEQTYHYDIDWYAPWTCQGCREEQATS